MKLTKGERREKKKKNKRKMKVSGSSVKDLFELIINKYESKRHIKGNKKR